LTEMNGFEVNVVPQQGGQLEVGAGASESAGAVLSKLLSPPMVPDASWFAAASAALLSATSLDPPLVLATLSLHSLVTVISDKPLILQVLSRPKQHRECAQLVQCLRSGSFRTQSAVLEFLTNAVGRSLSTADKSDDTHAGQLHPRIPQAYFSCIQYACIGNSRRSILFS
jgi:hypothetical protein